MKLPVGNTCMVVCEGPLVGTPGCWTGLGCKGGKGCRGRVKGWVGMLSPVTSTWLWFCFCFLPSTLKEMKVIDNSQQKFSFLNHSLKHHSFKTLLSLSHLQTGEDIPSMTFLWPFCLCKHTWRKLIHFSLLSSPHSLPCPDTLHNVLFYHHEVCIFQCNLETWIQWNTMPKSLKVSIKKKILKPLKGLNTAVLN